MTKVTGKARGALLSISSTTSILHIRLMNSVAFLFLCRNKDDFNTQPTAS